MRRRCASLPACVLAAVFLVLGAVGSAGPARAHVPHDTAVAVAAPADLNLEEPWYLVADPYENSLLLRREAGDRGWYHLGGEPVADDLLDAAMLADGTLTVLADSRLWWLEADGWYEEALPGALTASVAVENGLVLIGENGLWSWTAEQGFVAELPGRAFRTLGEGPVAVDADLRVWFSEDGHWSSVTAPGEPGAVVLGDEAYLADMDGHLWWLDGDEWSACGALPEPSGELSREVRQLAWDGERLLAAPGWKGPFVSADGCESWEDRAVPGVPGGDGFGQARTAAEVWRVLTAWGDRWLIGGYFGVFLSEDAGESWVELPFLSPAATRGLAFSPAFESDRGVYWGTYAAGVAISHDDGDSFVAPGHGLDEGNVQDIRTSDNTQEHVITVVSGHVAYHSHDAGQSWTSFPQLPGQVTRVFPWDGGLEYWAIPYQREESLLESLDGGQTWSTPETLVAALDGAQPAAAARCQGDCDGDWRCLTAVNPTTLLCSTDGGESWEVWYRGEQVGEEEGRDAVTEPVLMPRNEPEVVIFGDPRGLHRIADRGATWVNTSLPGDDVPVELACAAGDHAFAATRAGRILRSDDRGQSWNELDLRLTSQATVMVSSPGFLEEAHLLVANLEGVWALEDPTGAATLAPWTAWQRVDDHSGFLVKEDCPAPRSADGASMDSRQPLPDGCVITTDLQGEIIRVLGKVDEGGEARLLVDGVYAARLPDDTQEEPRILALVEGLEPGWHRVELVGEGNDGLEIDALEATGPEGFRDASTLGSRCSCGHGRRAWGALLLALAVALFRRPAAPRRARLASEEV